MPTTVRGTFDVKLVPQPLALAPEGSGLGRMSLDKRYHGELDATGVGEMLSAMAAVKGSAGYVAIERVSGTLQGRSGSFVLQHSGTLERGAPTLSVTVVPDSGTAELAGLTGSMAIEVEPGVHRYAFTYEVVARG
jgi:hypothetical protein